MYLIQTCHTTSAFLFVNQTTIAQLMAIYLHIFVEAVCTLKNLTSLTLTLRDGGGDDDKTDSASTLITSKCFYSSCP